MNDVKAISLLCFILYLLLVALMVVATSSWMINIENTNRWRNWLNNILTSDAAIIREAYRSW